LKARARQATNTTSFLHEQLEAAKTKLADQEQKLKDFKMQYLGSLPEQQQGNLAILASVQSQLQSTQDSLDRARQQKVYLQSMMDGYRRLASQAASLEAMGGVGPAITAAEPDGTASAARANVMRLRAREAELRTTYGAQYPEVLEVQRQIAAEEGALASASPAQLSGAGDDARSEKAATNRAQNCRQFSGQIGRQCGDRADSEPIGGEPVGDREPVQ
jgi:succinoglycan biosynthesis transport protein ExoP